MKASCLCRPGAWQRFLKLTLGVILPTVLVACNTGEPPVPPANALTFDRPALNAQLQVAQGAAQTVRVTNTTPDATITYRYVDPGTVTSGLFAYVIDSEPGATLAPGQSRELQVQLECPVEPGPYTSTVQLQYADHLATLPVSVQCSDAPIPTVVADETRVLNTSGQLRSYDAATGRLIFPTTSDYAQKLQVNDVVVAGIQPATPQGLLRKVVAVQHTGTEVIVDTAEAGLGDALAKAEFDETLPASFDDVASINVHEPGIHAQVTGVGPQAVLTYRFNKVLFDADGDDSTTNDRFAVSGDVTLSDPAFQFSGGLAVRYKKILFIKIPVGIDLNLKSRAAIAEQAHLNASGTVKVNRVKRFDISTIEMQPIEFAIGPVPVVITQQVDLFLDVGADLSVSLNYTVDQTASLKMGFDYVGRKFTPIADRTFTFKHDLDFSGTLAAWGYPGARYTARLYGTAGLFAEGAAGAKVTTALPTFRRFEWEVELCGNGVVGIAEWTILRSPKIGIPELAQEIFTVCSPPLASGVLDRNHAPTVSLRVENSLPTLSYKRPFTVVADAADADGDTLSYVWQPTPRTSTLGRAEFLIPTPGTHSIHATVDDGYLGRATATLDVTVVNHAPTPTITTYPTGELINGSTHTLRAMAVDPDEGPGPGDGVLDCSALTWSSSSPLDTFVLTPDGCTVAMTVVGGGMRTVTATATDPDGEKGSHWVQLQVGQNAPPEIRSVSIFYLTRDGLTPLGNDRVSDRCALYFRADWYDPDPEDDPSLYWSGNPVMRNMVEVAYPGQTFTPDTPSSVTVEITDFQHPRVSKTVPFTLYSDGSYSELCEEVNTGW